MSRNTKIAAIAAIVTMLAGSGFILTHRERVQAVPSNAADTVPVYWYDPMHPGQHFDKPGKSPFMDMSLVPKYSDRPTTVAGASPGRIAVDSRMVQTLGIRFTTVERRDFARRVDTVGLVSVDEHHIEAIEVRQPGWVERLEVRAAGDSVYRGQLLASVYSPDLLATQQELLIARGAADPQLIEAARRRLGLFGLSNSQIARIEKSGRVERRIEYYSPFEGYVMDLGVRQGVAIEAGSLLFQLADLRTVWVTAEVPEAQAGWIQVGDRAETTLPALPSERFEGRIDYLYPELNSATRTLKVRIVIQNPHRTLRPGMFTTTQLTGTPLTQVLTVPTEAVIRTGTRSIVIVADDATHFSPAVVRIGTELGDRSQILEGLIVGQRIVSSGQFLLDSEANLRGAFDNLAGSDDSPNGTH